MTLDKCRTNKHTLVTLQYSIVIDCTCNAFNKDENVETLDISPLSIIHQNNQDLLGFLL